MTDRVTDLDDGAAMAHVDASNMLRAVATSAAQVRASLTAVREAALDRLDQDTRPRALVVCGMGGSGIAGEVVAAIAGMTCPVPIVVHRGYGLPGWVGASDVVVAVSCSGTTQETLTAASEAVRRAARVVGVGTSGSALQETAEHGGGCFVAVRRELSPRSSLWALATPVLVVAERFGLLDLAPDESALESAAVRLEQIAEACRPDRESFVNPAKLLAEELAGALPMVWGAGQVGPVAANRMVCQLAENAKQLAVLGSLPEAHHNLVVGFDGVGSEDPDADFFRDRVEEPTSGGLRLVVVRDDSDDVAIRRADASADLAGARGIPVTTLRAEGDSAVERLASLVGLIDFASVYLALGRGVDPTPIGPIDELKAILA